MQAERDENNCREDLTPTEIVEIGRAIEALEKPKAKERLKDAGRAGGKASGKLPEASTGDTRDKVGAALGVSGKTYEKAKQVVVAAEAEPREYLLDGREQHQAEPLVEAEERVEDHVGIVTRDHRFEVDAAGIEQTPDYGVRGHREPLSPGGARVPLV